MHPDCTLLFVQTIIIYRFNALHYTFGVGERIIVVDVDPFTGVNAFLLRSIFCSNTFFGFGMNLPGVSGAGFFLEDVLDDGGAFGTIAIIGANS